MGATIGILFLVFIFSVIFPINEIFISKTNTGLVPNIRNMDDLLQLDSDTDGVADWEETLWGTDKTNKETFGMPDSIYIQNKKKELNLEENEEKTIAELTETDKFARSFFTSFVALKDQGEDSLITNFAKNMGTSMVSAELPTKYFEADILIKELNTLESKNAYYEKAKTLFEKYKEAGIGKEINIIAKNMVESEKTNNFEDTKGYQELLPTGDAYITFAKELSKIETPKSLSKIHLDILNGAHNTGLSVLNMQKMILDPIAGLSGISQYQKYSKELISGVLELEKILSKETEGDIIQ